MRNAYKLELIKKISLKSLQEGGKDSSDIKYDYSVLGNFQRMRVTEVADSKNFKDMAQYPKSIARDNVRYYTFALFFFDAAKHDVKPFLHKDKHYYMITTVNFNSNGFFDVNDKNKKTPEEIIGTLQRSIPKKFKEKHDNMELNINVYAGMGSTDIIIITSAKNLTDLPKIWSILDNLTLNDINDGNTPPTKNGKKSIFESAGSFFVIHDKLNVNKGNDHVTANLLYRMGDMKTGKIDPVALFKNVFNKSVGDKSVEDLSSIQGEQNISIFLKDVPLKELICLLGIREKDFMDALEIENKALYRVAQKIQKFMDMNVDSYTVRLFSDDKTYDTINLPVVTKNNDHSKCIYTLEKLRDEVEGKIPVSVKRTLDYLVDKCICMLRSNKKYISSIRMYRLLKRVMNLIKNNTPKPGESFSHVISECLSKLSTTISTVLMANNLSLDQLIGNDVETINPATKLFYAYESMIGKLYQRLSIKEEMSPLFFLTVSPDNRVSSQTYILNKADPGHKIISINLPDVSYFYKRRTMAYIAHEFSHYIALPTKLKRTKIIALKDMLHSYVCVFTWDYISAYIAIPIEKFSRFITLFLDKYVHFNFIKVGSIEEFTHQYIAFLGEAYNELRVNKELFTPNDNPEENLLYICLCSAFQELRMSYMTVKVFGNILREARADIFMCSICDFDFMNYIRCHFDYMTDTLLESPKVDVFYLKRLSMVLHALLKGDENRIETVRTYAKTVSQSQNDFIIQITDYWYDNEGTFDCAVDYLTEAYDYSKKRLQNDNYNHILKIYNVRSDDFPDDMLKYLYSEWLESMHYWRKYKDAD
jgi:hypothetical protein